MVFQRDVDTNVIFGAASGTAVKLTVGGKTVEGKISSGSYRLNLPKFPAGGPYSIEVQEFPSQKKITLSNILFGDVFFCSGQSNMAWPISKTWEFQKVVQESEKYPNIRFLVFFGGVIQWKVTSSKTTAENSAVCYFFALELHKKLKIPIGTISSSIGGTPIEHWMTKSSAEACNSSQPGGRLYTAMLLPFADVTFKGFNWYQGENNAGQYQKYRCQLPAFLKDIRKLYRHNFSFTFVQLAGYDWGEFRPIRQVQQESLVDMPNSGMATAIDLGEMKDIHPRKKDELGRRIQLVVSALAYGEKIDYEGPKLKSIGHERNGNMVKFNLEFEIFGGRSNGLILQPSTFCTTCCQSTKTIFMVITQNAKVYHPDMISVGTGNSVQFSVQIPSNEKVVEVRYAWEKYSQCVIAGKDSKLPITPFVKKFAQ